jgi:type I restriction enzyme S subunit
MSDWGKFKLGDTLNKIVGGGTPSKSIPEYWNGDIFWCSVKDMADDKFSISSTEDKISSLGLAKSASNLIKAGTVITATRMGLGRAFINNIDMAINQDLKALYPNEKIDNRFLLWTIINKRVEIDSLGTGATVKGITLETLKSIEINLPPLPTQKRIDSILSANDDLI